MVQTRQYDQRPFDETMCDADTSPSYLLFQTLLPLFWTLTCMIWMELTRNDAVFSRITMVLFMCRSKCSRNDLKLHGTTFQKIRKIPAKDEGQGAHHLSTRVGACPLPRGPPGDLPTPTPTLYICFRGEKNRREEFITFYDTEPSPSPKISREG